MEILAIAIGLFVAYVGVRAAIWAADTLKAADKAARPEIISRTAYSGPLYNRHGREIG